MRRRGALDWFGFIALSVAVAATQLMFDRGQRLDWFESDEILLWAVLALLGYYLFIVHSLTTAEPFLDMRMFRDRNFAVGLILMFVFGLLVFVPMVLIPTDARAPEWLSGAHDRPAACAAWHRQHDRADRLRPAGRRTSTRA